MNDLHSALTDDHARDLLAMPDDLRTRAIKAIHTHGQRPWESNPDTAAAFVDTILAVVRAELLAIAKESGSDGEGLTIKSLIRDLADRIAPEGDEDRG